MKIVTLLIALSALLLTACAEDGTGSNANGQSQQGSTTNPFDTAPVPSASDEPVASNDPPIANPPVQQPPVAQPPVTQPPAVPDGNDPVSPTSVDTNSLTNGRSEATASTVWVCAEDGTSADTDLIVIAFFEDGDAVIADDDNYLLLNWTSSGDYLEIVDDGQFFVRLDNIVVDASAGTLNMTFTQADGQSGSVSCNLANLDGTPATQAKPIPPVAPTGNGEGSGGSNPIPALQPTIVNAFVNGELQSLWQCRLADGTQVAAFFLADGIGAIISDLYSDGIVMRWSANSQGINISLDDGNQVILSSPVFTGNEFFRVDNVNYQGADIPGMECQLLVL